MRSQQALTGPDKGLRVPTCLVDHKDMDPTYRLEWGPGHTTYLELHLHPKRWPTWRSGVLISDSRTVEVTHLCARRVDLVKLQLVGLSAEL